MAAFFGVWLVVRNLHQFEASTCPFYHAEKWSSGAILRHRRGQVDQRMRQATKRARQEPLGFLTGEMRERLRTFDWFCTSCLRGTASSISGRFEGTDRHARQIGMNHAEILICGS